MAKTKYFIELVDKVHDACNEMTATLDALERKENECNMLFAEVDALERKVASLESIQQDAFALMDACEEECNDYVKLADARTDAAKAETKNWYSNSVMYDDERRAANTARKAVEMKLRQCRVREASIFEDYEQLLSCYNKDTENMSRGYGLFRESYEEQNAHLRAELNKARRREDILIREHTRLVEKCKYPGITKDSKPVKKIRPRVIQEKHDTTDAAPLGDITNIFRACIKKE